MDFPSASEQYKILVENTEEIISEDEFLEKLTDSVVEKKPLRCKLGIDPSAPDIHLGHAVVLNKLRQFQELGHHIIIILGDFTGRVGDPTGRSEMRKQLSTDDVLRNAKTYQEQIFHILDKEKTELVFNSQWLAALNFAEVIELASKLTVARMMEREDFSNRYNNNIAIGIHEFFYPLMQGYDSIAIRADVEFGATEQKFNLLMGRQLQRDYGQKPQVAFTMPILPGTDGQQKMSKTLNNYIGITEDPDQIYGKVMSISDDLMPQYYRLATFLKAEEISSIFDGIDNGSIHPRDAKMRLAREIVTLYHSIDAADMAENRFKQVFQKKEIPENMPEFKITSSNLVDALAISGLVSSKSEARRLIRQGGVKVNGETVNNQDYLLPTEGKQTVKVGKRRFGLFKVEGNI